MMKVHDSVIHPWNYVVTPFPVADHVYYVGNRWVGSYLLDSGKGLILIDCAMPQTLYLLLDGIRSLGYDPHDIRLLLISHAHYDHAGAAEALRRYTGAQLWLGRDDVPFIGHPELLLADPCNCPDFQVDACYEPGQPICLGRFSIRAEHTPGHTPGAILLFRRYRKRTYHFMRNAWRPRLQHHERCISRFGTSATQLAPGLSARTGTSARIPGTTSHWLAPQRIPYVRTLAGTYARG